MIKVIKLSKLKTGKKKYEIVFEKNGKRYIRKFGAAGMSDFTKHKDKKRRERYISRHLKDLRTGDPMAPGYLSMYILWNKPSLKASLADYKRRLNVYNRTGKFPKEISGSKKLSFGTSSLVPVKGTMFEKLPDEILTEYIQKPRSATVIQRYTKSKQRLIDALKTKKLRPVWKNLDLFSKISLSWYRQATERLNKSDFEYKNLWWEIINYTLLNINRIYSSPEILDELPIMKQYYFENIQIAVIELLNKLGYNSIRSDDVFYNEDWTPGVIKWWNSTKLAFGTIEFENTTLRKLPVDVQNLIQREVSASDIQRVFMKKNSKEYLLKLLQVKASSKKEKRFREKLWLNLDIYDDFTVSWLQKASLILKKDDFNFITKNFWWKVIQSLLEDLIEIEFEMDSWETIPNLTDYNNYLLSVKYIIKIYNKVMSHPEFLAVTERDYYTSINTRAWPETSTQVDVYRYYFGAQKLLKFWDTSY